MTLVDTNILLDLATNDPNWSDWSLKSLEAASLRGAIVINAIVYAEFSVRYEQIEDVDAFLEAARIEIDPMPRAALFLAGKAFAEYKRNSGSRTGVLPDFFIGAHAAVAKMPLLTRDLGRYRTYFPTLDLIAR